MIVSASEPRALLKLDSGCEFAASAVERVIPITTPTELANRFRKNADDCDRAAITDIGRIGRDRLMKTAALYRSLANKIEPRQDQLRNDLRATPQV